MIGRKEISYLKTSGYVNNKSLNAFINYLVQNKLAVIEQPTIIINDDLTEEEMFKMYLLYDKDNNKIKLMEILTMLCERNGNK